VVVLLDVLIFLAYFFYELVTSFAFAVVFGFILFLITGLFRMIFSTPAFTFGTTVQILAHTLVINALLTILPDLLGLSDSNIRYLQILVLIFLYLLKFSPSALAAFAATLQPGPVPAAAAVGPAPAPAPAAPAGAQAQYPQPR